MKRLRTISWAIAVAAVSGAVLVGRASAGEPRTIAECETIQAADAYNQCLAKFGPTSKLHNLEPERPGDVKASGAEAAASAAPLAVRGHHGRGRHAASHRGGGFGRKRVQFTITHRAHK